MNLIVCMLAGAVLGWAGYAFLGMNENRNKMVAIVIGALGGFVGAKLVAPMFTSVAAPGDFSLAVLFTSALVAAAFLAVGNLVHNRWGV